MGKLQQRSSEAPSHLAASCLLYVLATSSTGKCMKPAVQEKRGIEQGSTPGPRVVAAAPQFFCDLKAGKQDLEKDRDMFMRAESVSDSSIPDHNSWSSRTTDSSRTTFGGNTKLPGSRNRRCGLQSCCSPACWLDSLDCASVCVRVQRRHTTRK